MADTNFLGTAQQMLMPTLKNALQALSGGEEETPAGPDTSRDDAYLELFKKAKRESFENRWIWERGWMRNIHYVNNRHWIEYVKRSNEWRDVRLAKWFPKPVTNKIGEGVQALRAMFCSVNIGINVRPVGADAKNVAVAAICDELAPLLHEEHHMDDVMNEHDFWFIVTGNAFLHTYLERDVKHGASRIPMESCTACGEEYTSDEIAEAGQACPGCGATGPLAFQPAVDEETGEPKEKVIPNGKGVTVALSPFELAFPQTYARFEDVPYVIRLRWRPKSYYKNNPKLWSQVQHLSWGKAPSEQALQLFRSLPFHNDMGVAPFLGGGNEEEEGTSEYELWMRPCDEYPDGLVIRVVGDGEPTILHLEDEEAIPGPLPYVDAGGQPVFTFSHSAFEQRGGRVYGTSPLDSVIQKQNQLNQLDAFILMIVNRMGNPLWLVPKGAEIEKFTGEPGLVVKWNPLTVGGNAKPERVDGLGPNASLFQIRDMYLKDIEEGLGTYNVVKGSKPAGVEAFSAMQLLVERSQSRFASAFKSRGNLYKDWAKFALEIEREFGPSERTHNILTPARTWTQKMFQNANLQGAFTVVVEDGSNTPKTMLGERAAIEHLNGMGLIDKMDNDQRYTIFRKFGQASLAPSLDIHMQAALRKQQAFEEWAGNPEAQQQSMGQAQQEFAEYQQQLQTAQDPTQPLPTFDVNKHTPLAWKPWFKADIHMQEFLKWMNSDKMIQLLQQNPALEQLVVAHQQAMQLALAPPPVMGAPVEGDGKGAAGGAQAMNNSNKESGGSQNSDGGHAGPRQG